MAKNLLIVESPAKSRTIGKYLGKDFVIKASMGHVIDLPVKELGIDIENNFKPKYVTMKGKAKVISELRKAAEKAQNIFLAPDPDREGEAIAWHISEIVSKANPKAVIHRVLLNEITQNAVRKAVDSPLSIDMRKVHAQQARRILDRIVGYKISPFLWKTVYRGLSAGRVQSVALRLICQREDERDAFKPQEYWTLEVRVKTREGAECTVKLFKIDAKDPELGSKEAVSKIIELVTGKEWKITEINKKRKSRNPALPFITRTIQQEAARKLHFSASRTMLIAQQLYEGIDMGDDRVGLITYMRTDSTRLSEEAKQAAAALIGSLYGDAYVPAKSKEYKKSEQAQDAHEAIRPSVVETAYAPESLKNYLTADQFKLYDLIWKRFFASQMESAQYDLTTIDIPVENCLFRAAGSILVFDGFTRVYNEDNDDDKEGKNSGKDVLLPQLSEGEILQPISFDDQQHFTQPPPRYSEASLVKELEKQGIGRPSTYAQIIDTLKRRKYVDLVERRFSPSLLGKTVNSILTGEFPDIFDVTFTANMENELDKVESGEDNWTNLLNQFYQPLARDLKKAQEKIKGLKKSLEEDTKEPCSECGKGTMVVKWGKNGRFLACSEYPRCHHTSPVEKEELESPKIEMNCRKCGSPMLVKKWKSSRFLGCSRYPECKTTMPYPTGIKCPEQGCPGYIAERYSPKGKIFFSCSTYPSCKFATWNRPVNQPCTACGAPFMVERNTKGKETSLRCLTCKNELVLQHEEAE
ncbi:MAG: DNA topoisomerase I [Candidatus Raymondbacteria bacterium RIFOXYD12_FULL_49_13]|uniref:DNA topoisomerase 1 n=1 Tax=Candidatus Raymondbacteria bacterium RIFOXYD12_FULL_49_13 TaxID=1817890 RepID=A0A1F7F516_UNCRA|nr:MAG: DNA topoisomerase I [Candidatus Raymondbacteria bacterium RIFOXYD12_FULL_49_13]